MDRPINVRLVQLLMLIVAFIQGRYTQILIDVDLEVFADSAYHCGIISRHIIDDKAIDNAASDETVFNAVLFQFFESIRFTKKKTVSMEFITPSP